MRAALVAHFSLFSLKIAILRFLRPLGLDSRRRAALYLIPSRGVAQFGSAPAWGVGGRWFKSSLPDQSDNRARKRRPVRPRKRPRFWGAIVPKARFLLPAADSRAAARPSQPRRRRLCERRPLLPKDRLSQRGVQALVPVIALALSRAPAAELRVAVEGRLRQPPPYPRIDPVPAVYPVEPVPRPLRLDSLTSRRARARRRRRRRRAGGARSEATVRAPTRAQPIRASAGFVRRGRFPDGTA